jgi:hypothetical protein
MGDHCPPSWPEFGGRMIRRIQVTVDAVKYSCGTVADIQKYNTEKAQGSAG